ncbi:unnamed protein product [Strongylus vulgaris]|uniref:Uncharacterized protein n=1 Tax=Strongylus vulgaris TaxID=40348 RepID=A0A3P7I0N9_STRVU|nr:unnamed protein product [Strongylus vulgaris]
MYVDNALLKGNSPEKFIENYAAPNTYLSNCGAVNAKIRTADRAKTQEIIVLGLKIAHPIGYTGEVSHQGIHKQKLGWDASLPDEESQRWSAIKDGVVGFETTIPRKVMDKRPKAEYKLSIFVEF